MFAFTLPCLKRVKMRKGGRPTSSIWSQFTEVEDGGGTKMRCMTCFTLVSKRADRMAGHLNTSCKAKSASSKRSRHDEAGPQQDAATDDEVTILDSPSTSGSSQVGSAPHQQPKLTPWVVKTDASTRDKLDRTVAEFFYGCNVPFSVADHPLFISFHFIYLKSHTQVKPIDGGPHSLTPTHPHTHPYPSNYRTHHNIHQNIIK